MLPSFLPSKSNDDDDTLSTFLSPGRKKMLKKGMNECKKEMKENFQEKGPFAACL